MHDLLLTLGFGLVTASILALSAVAFTLEYGVTNVANLSHGEILTVGAYAAFVVHRLTGNAIIDAVAAALAGGLLALAVHWAVVDRFIRRGAASLTVFIATLGVSFAIQYTLAIIFGSSNVAYTISQGAPHQVGPFLWTRTGITIIVSALAITAMLYAIISRTRFGKALRAVSQNRELAGVSGIDAHLVAAATWFLAGLVAGYAGFVLAETIGTFSPTFGFGFFLITLTAAVAGGLGRAFSTLAGAVIVGIVLEFTGAYISASYNLAFAFAILAIIILVRPRGLFTSARRTVFE
ncbi:MAG TPA: branched-chain amino acid ABC transporter permease [Candidatus Dormibacteraeota bacterium]|nr:branched-chain amino acid ABC transporter permease [Candidatus Dormibacteraeota bacterium]